MARFVIDPSTLAYLVEADEIIDPSHRLVAPKSIRSRTLDLLLHQVQGGALSNQEALALHDRVTEMKIRLLDDRVSRRTAWNMAIAHGWNSLEDAEYLAVAQLQADALITLRPALTRLATGIVPLAEVRDLFSS